jgi:nicotinamide riboside kinase
MEEPYEPGPLRRVVLTGAESTGKTTLAARLADHYGTVWLPEYARTFAEARGDLPGAADVPAIARGFLDAEATLLPRAHRLLLYDTDLVSTCVYSRFYYGGCPDWIERAATARHADLYLLADLDAPWVPDPGVRDTPEARLLLHERFRQELAHRRLPHLLLSGPLDARMQTALAAIDALLRDAG